MAARLIDSRWRATVCDAGSAVVRRLAVQTEEETGLSNCKDYSVIKSSLMKSMEASHVEFWPRELHIL